MLRRGSIRSEIVDRIEDRAQESLTGIDTTSLVIRARVADAADAVEFAALVVAISVAMIGAVLVVRVLAGMPSRG